jgi:hypothetical protein
LNEAALQMIHRSSCQDLLSSGTQVYVQRPGASQHAVQLAHDACNMPIQYLEQLQHQNNLSWQANCLAPRLVTHLDVERLPDLLRGLACEPQQAARCVSSHDRLCSASCTGMLQMHEAFLPSTHGNPAKHWSWLPQNVANRSGVHSLLTLLHTMLSSATKRLLFCCCWHLLHPTLTV